MRFAVESRSNASYLQHACGLSVRQSSALPVTSAIQPVGRVLDRVLVRVGDVVRHRLPRLKRLAVLINRILLGIQHARVPRVASEFAVRRVAKEHRAGVVVGHEDDDVRDREHLLRNQRDATRVNRSALPGQRPDQRDKASSRSMIHQQSSAEKREGFVAVYVILQQMALEGNWAAAKGLQACGVCASQCVRCTSHILYGAHGAVTLRYSDGIRRFDKIGS